MISGVPAGECAGKRALSPRPVRTCPVTWDLYGRRDFVCVYVNISANKFAGQLEKAQREVLRCNWVPLFRADFSNITMSFGNGFLVGVPDFMAMVMANIIIYFNDVVIEVYYLY